MYSFTRSRLRVENSRSRSWNRPKTGRLRNPGGQDVSKGWVLLSPTDLIESALCFVIFLSRYSLAGYFTGF